MQFLVVFTNKPHFATAGLPADFAERFAEDGAHLRALYARGIARNIWTIDRPERGGVVLFETASREDLDAVLADIPFVRIGYNDHEVLPLGPYPAFGPDPSPR